jgi:hypothetical protein
VGRPRKDPYDLDAEFGRRRTIGKVPKTLKRRNTMAVGENESHSNYLAPKYSGPGLSYRRNPFQDANARYATAPSATMQKNVVGKKSPKKRKPRTNRRQSVPMEKVTRRQSMMTERRDPSARIIKKPVRYDEEYGLTPQASTRKSSRNRDANDSGLVCTIDSDAQLQSEHDDSFKLWLDNFSRSPPKSTSEVSGLVDQMKLWLESNPEPPKPANAVSIDSMSIRGGGVSDSEDEVPTQAVVSSTPKNLQKKPLRGEEIPVGGNELPVQAVATPKTMELRRPHQLGA